MCKYEGKCGMVEKECPYRPDSCPKYEFLDDMYRFFDEEPVAPIYFPAKRLLTSKQEARGGFIE